MLGIRHRSLYVGRGEFFHALGVRRDLLLVLNLLYRNGYVLAVDAPLLCVSEGVAIRAFLAKK